MRLCKFRSRSGEVRVAVLEEEVLRTLANGTILADVLHAADPRAAATGLLDGQTVPLGEAALLAPIDRQEIWAAGVTYKRSQEARERESEGAAQFYDKVYSAQRPELFLKAPAWRVRSPGETVRYRKDSRWSVPEPELALVVSPQGKLVGCTLGNDMSARDIEGENPLYLPQAKVYDGACSVGPAVLLAADLPPLEKTTLRLTIERGGKPVFEGSTTLAAMKRTFEELIGWLYKETSFPDGAVLLTGTGIVPPDDFTLAVGDAVHIEATGIGRLSNPVG